METTTMPAPQNNKLEYSTYSGIPPSITLELAQSKLGPSKPKVEFTKPIQEISKSKVETKEEVKRPNFNQDMARIKNKDEQIKMTLQEIIDCNANLITTVQTELDKQSELLEKLLKML